jgi:hypothetical protein
MVFVLYSWKWNLVLRLKNIVQQHATEFIKFSYIVYVGVIRFIFLIGNLYLIGVRLCKDQSTSTMKTHAEKGLDYFFEFY